MDISANVNSSMNTHFSVKHEAIIGLVMRQTNYTRQEAIEKLTELQGNYIQVIKNYINPDFKEKEKKNKTVNQSIMSELRYFMDGVNRGYEDRKKKEIIKKNIIAYHMLKQQQQKQQADTNIIVKPENSLSKNPELS